MKPVLSVLFAALFVTGAGAAPTPKVPLQSYREERNDLRLEVMGLLEKDKIEELEALVTRLRKDKARYSNEDPKITTVYFALIDLPAAVRDAAMARWREKNPSSTVLPVLEGSLLMYNALGKSGAEQTEGLEKAWGVLQDADARGIPDPVIYYDLIKICRYLSKTEADVDRLVERALKIDPDNVDTYAIATHFVYRRSKTTAEVVAFVTATADRRKDDALYAKLATYVTDLAGEGDRKGYAFAWDRIRRGFQEILRRSPKSSWRWNEYLQEACAYRDREAAARAAAVLEGHWSDDSHYMWRYPLVLEKCTGWATGKAEPPSAVTAAGEGPASPAAARTRAADLVSLVAERKEFQDKVTALADANDFDALEALGDRLRRDKLRMVSGLPQLYDYHADLSALPTGKAEPFVKRWREARPKSVAAHMLDASLHVRAAWKARGSGYINTVPESALKIMNDELAEAWSILMAAERLGTPDPMLYSRMLDACRTIGKTPAETFAILDRGLKVDADFETLYFDIAEYLLPRWMGSAPMLTAYVTKVGDRKGDVFYARLVWYITSFERHDIARAYSFSWPRIKKGYEEMLTQYPKSSREWNAYLWLACEYRDRPTSAALVGLLKDHWTADSDLVWQTRPRFDECVAWATEPAPESAVPAPDAVVPR
jgi:hypothetical protein